MPILNWLGCFSETQITRTHVIYISILWIIALIPTRRKGVSDIWPHPDPSASLTVRHAVNDMRERERERCVRKPCTGAKYCKMKRRCIGIISRGIDSSGRPMIYTTGVTGGCSPHVFYMHARVGRCMHATKEKWNNDVSFNASVAIFYLRITRDNGRPRVWIRAKTVVSCHTRVRAHERVRTHTHTHTSVRETRPLLYSLYKRAFV